MRLQLSQGEEVNGKECGSQGLVRHCSEMKCLPNKIIFPRCFHPSSDPIYWNFMLLGGMCMTLPLFQWISLSRINFTLHRDFQIWSL